MNIRNGFAIIDLMVISLLYGPIAALAIPGFVQYINDSKSSEAKTNLRNISDGALAFYYAEHVGDAEGLHVYNNVYPNCGSAYGDNGITITGCKSGQNPIGKPASAATIGIKNDPNAYSEALRSDPWKSLRFTVVSPFYYYYDYASNDGGSNASKFAASASASLNSECDSIYTIRGTSTGMLGTIIDVSDDKSACNKATITD